MQSWEHCDPRTVPHNYDRGLVHARHKTPSVHSTDFECGYPPDSTSCSPRGSATPARLLTRSFRGENDEDCSGSWTARTSYGTSAVASRGVLYPFPKHFVGDQTLRGRRFLDAPSNVAQSDVENEVASCRMIAAAQEQLPCAKESGFILAQS